MITKLSNCQTLRLSEPMLAQTEHQKHLYVFEALSYLTVYSSQGQFILEPFDMVVAQSLDFQLEASHSQGILARYASIYFDLPGSIQQYAVGDNPLIHDLMNEEISSMAYVVFKGLGAKICHSYMTVLECLQQESDDVYLQFQKQKVASLLFSELLREHERKISKSASRFPNAEVKYASKETQSGMIMKYITEHIATVTLKETADHFSYQSNYFSRLCHELFGVTFNVLKQQIRLEVAKEQLRLTTKSLEEISQELGYKAVSNFHRNFKAATGLTPKEYRQQARTPFFELD